MHPEFKIKNIFSKEENHKVFDSVNKLRDYWINRGGYFEYPFYSLGPASYLDAFHSKETYYKLVEKYRPLMEKEFAWLYEKILKFLMGEFVKDRSSPVPTMIYHPHQALPGFHIFLADDLFEIPIASRHVDLQYRDLDWKDIKFDTKDCRTFTAYFKLPSAGGGIYIWDYSYDDLKNLDTQEREKKLAETQSEYCKFTEGDIVLHTGLKYHQIAPMEDIQEDDIRLSLQGHLILAQDGTYYIYW